MSSWSITMCACYHGLLGLIVELEAGGLSLLCWRLVVNGIFFTSSSSIVGIVGQLNSFGTSVPVFALPEGLTVKQGNITTQTSDNTLTINQGTNRALGDWNSFDIQKNETVNINQPSVESIMVGRITGGTRTEIFGNLNATGGVILINPKGMLFGSENLQTSIRIKLKPQANTVMYHTASLPEGYVSDGGNQK